MFLEQKVHFSLLLGQRHAFRSVSHLCKDMRSSEAKKGQNHAIQAQSFQLKTTADVKDQEQKARV